MSKLSGQDKDIRILKLKKSKVEAEYITEKSRRDRQYKDLLAKVELLKATLYDMGENLASLTSDLDVWAQSHVNMQTR